MLELSKLDPDVESVSRVKTRRAFSREGSLTRINSYDAPFLDILSRIRVPSQRAAMAEMAAAAERVYSQGNMIHRGRTPIVGASAAPPPPSPMNAAPPPSPMSDCTPAQVFGGLVQVLEQEQYDAADVDPEHATSPPAIALQLPSGVHECLTGTMEGTGTRANGDTTAEQSQHQRGGREAWMAQRARPGAEPRAPPPPNHAGIQQRLQQLGGTVPPQGVRAGGTVPPSSSSGSSGASGSASAPVSPARSQRHHAHHAHAVVSAPGPGDSSSAGPSAGRASAGAAACAGPSSAPLTSPHLTLQGAHCPPHLVPTAFQWLGAASAAFICGTFNGWGERIPMLRHPLRDEWCVSPREQRTC